MLMRIFISFCLIFSNRSAKDGLSNFGGLLMGIGAIGVYLLTNHLIVPEQAAWFGLAPLVGGGLIGWATSRPDNLGLRG